MLELLEALTVFKSVTELLQPHAQQPTPYHVAAPPAPYYQPVYQPVYAPTAPVQTFMTNPLPQGPFWDDTRQARPVYTPGHINTTTTINTHTQQTDNRVYGSGNAMVVGGNNNGQVILIRRRTVRKGW